MGKNENTFRYFPTFTYYIFTFQDYSDSFEDYSDSFDAMFSDVFPLWRDDIGDYSNVQRNDEERPKLFIPRK